MPSGILTNYNFDRGFGFFGRRPRGTFVHFRAFEKAGLNPVLGQAYRYETELDWDGRERAVDVALDDGFAEA